MPWFSRILWHSTRKQGGLSPMLKGLYPLTPTVASPSSLLLFILPCKEWMKNNGGGCLNGCHVLTMFKCWQYSYYKYRLKHALCQSLAFTTKRQISSVHTAKHRIYHITYCTSIWQKLTQIQCIYTTRHFLLCFVGSNIAVKR